MTATQTTLVKLIRQVMPEENQSWDIVGASRFVEDLEFDSLKSIMLATLIDDAFALALSTNMGELLKITTVAAACQFIDDIKGSKDQ